MYRYKYFFRWITTAGLCAVFLFAVYTFEQAIPDKIYATDIDELSYDFKVPVTVELEKNSIETVARDLTNPFPSASYHVICKLFGIFPVKSIEVFLVNEEELYAVGIPIGIYVETDGVFVIDTGVVVSENGEKKKPTEHILQPGDYIVSVNGTKVRKKEQLQELVRENGTSEDILGIRRENEYLEATVNAVAGEDGVCRIGAWVKDDLAGVGTMTYYTKAGEFSALGHAISDADNGKMIEIDQGRIYPANIIGVKKGEKGNPGELQGVVTYSKDSVLGKIEKNTKTGIFGTLYEKEKAESEFQSYMVGYKQTIQPGKAYILSSPGGKQEEYEIEIESLDYSGREKNKGILFRVTDKELLELTGGIVQGMSGSPIIQDNKLIGAVTHVLVNDPTRGYGIFIENMLEVEE